MDSFGAIRKLARAKHDEMKGQADGDLRGTSLLAAARRVTGIAAMRVPAQHPLLAGGSGALVGTAPALSIYIDDALDDVLAAYVEAHEFGHIWIETPIELAIVPRSSDPGNPEEHSPTGIRRVEAYSPEELRERHANVFAREFLLPCPEARRRFLLGHSASQIATDLGLPLRLVTQQLAVALLLPEPVDPKEVRSPVHPLDPSQRTAAEFEGAPLLVEAGPGTGKTKTLVGRIEHLLKKGVPAAGILILTFSNKAAREIRERIAKASPAAAGELWAGTFHSFGLELLRKYGDRENLRLPIQILDQADQLRFLEAELAELELDHFLWLSEPAFALRHVLGAISRAKDELFGPDEYAKAAARMLADAGADPKLILKAEKAAEVARVYRHYDMRLRADGVVDFADLINRPIELMRKHPEIRDELRQQYAHVLVDEYQDVNRASAVLLKELAGVGKTLWVVGDARQSIYRFRGAAPTNTTEFEKDYPQGVRKSLSVNYRSRQQIVRTFGTYADHMKVGVGRANNLEARRGPGPNAVDLNVATDKDSEIAGIAATIRAFKAKGVPYRCQAILCRGHSYLQEIAGALEAADIPVLNLGEIFEREEVRDLLAILSFVAEPHRGALMRLATLPRYRMPLDDVRTFLDAARDSGTTPLETLKGARKIERLSTRGQEALAILSADLAGVAFMSRPG